MKINCIAIDDEPLALDKLEQYILKIPYLNLIGKFDNAIQGLEFLKENGVDLIYLDINMPDLSGIEFIKGLQNPPKVIFTTAYNHFAIEGFELNATDYLLKPFSFDRFLKATERVYDLLSSKNIPKADDFMFIKSEHTILKINFADIHFIEGFKDYIKVFLTDSPKPQLTLFSLKSIEQLLPQNRFLRIHRSFIIAIDKIQAIRNGKVLIKDVWVPIGESYKELFEEVVLKGRMH